MTVLCSIPECGKSANRRGWCRMHYKRWRLYGDVEFTQITKRGANVKWIMDHSSYSDDKCLIWPFSSGKLGYPGLVIYLGKRTGATRVMCSLVNGPPPSPEYDAAHSCGKGHLGCISPKHLSWKTRIENVKDQIIHNTRRRGETHARAKLTEVDVLSIRGKYASGDKNMPELALEFGVTKGMVSSIISRKSWSHLACLNDRLRAGLRRGSVHGVLLLVLLKVA